MPHTKTALILLLAFALPSATEALGLGEIHVDSALNEPLAAEVEIVGATADDLAGITASIANRETFVRFGVDRPAFLSSATFRIAMDSKGQPVLAIRSTDSFTEPLINMLIDLRWHSGELIRQYTLLLDPARFQSDTRVADAVPTGSAPSAYTPPAAAEPVSETSQPATQATPSPEQTSPAVGEPISPETVKVAAGATLRGIASRISSRGDAGPERVMIAIFRANPKAFDDNINRLRQGAVLAIPSFSEISKISPADANHEFRVQMETWHASTTIVGPAKRSGLAVAAPAPVPYEAETTTEPAAMRRESTSNAPEGAIHIPGNSAETSDDAALDRRVQLLEKGLNELQGALDREQETLAGMRARVALADEARAVTVAPPMAKSGHPLGASIAAVLLLAIGAFGALYAWRSRQTTFNPTVSPAETRMQDSVAALTIAVQAAARTEVTPAAPAGSELPRVAQLEALPPAKDKICQSVADASAETANLASATADKSDADTAKLQYKVLDLDGAGYHVPMPGTLDEKGGFKERRTSLVDVLMVAVKREPNRRDLRMKLLETYYAAAAINRKGFLEVAQSLASERANMTDSDWGKIAGMARQIAADNDLFATDTVRADNKDLATCA
jgi:pilus assembly protein FimV